MFERFATIVRCVASLPPRLARRGARADAPFSLRTTTGIGVAFGGTVGVTAGFGVGAGVGDGDGFGEGVGRRSIAMRSIT